MCGTLIRVLIAHQHCVSQYFTRLSLLLFCIFEQITDPTLVKVYDTVVFEGPPKTEMKLWPAHCIQESWGSEIHEDLTASYFMTFQWFETKKPDWFFCKKVYPGSKIIYKGSRPTIDSFSGFFDNQKLNSTELEKLLKEKHVTDVFVCGLATDVCVGWYFQLK